jgi:RNA polymerase sigma-70 factor (ECF subfamily)
MISNSTSQFHDAVSVETLPVCQGQTPAARSQSTLQDLASQLHIHRPRHLRYLRSRLPSLEDAEDALQDAALKFIQSAESFASVERPDAWVAVSLRRVVVDRYRRTAAQRRMTEALAAEPPESTGQDEDETLTPTECVKSVLPTLKPEYAAILRQIYLDEASLKQVAARLGLTVNNVAVRLHRARGALRETMLDRCEVCPLADCWARHRPALLAVA